MVPSNVCQRPDDGQPGHGGHVGHVVAVGVTPLVALILKIYFQNLVGCKNLGTGMKHASLEKVRLSG